MSKTTKKNPALAETLPSIQVPLTEEKKRELLVHILESSLASSDAIIVKFQEELAKDPAHALKWSNSAFEAAGRKLVYNGVLNALKDGKDLEAVQKHCLTYALRFAKYPERSSSPCSNLMSQCEGAAWAEVLEYFPGGMNRLW